MSPFISYGTVFIMGQTFWQTFKKDFLSYLVWIDGDTKEAGVGVDELIFVSDNRIPQDTGIIKIGQT